MARPLLVGLSLVVVTTLSVPGLPARAHQADAPSIALFRAHDIDPAFRGGYAVALADFNRDGRLDVIANSLQVPGVAWYENPAPTGASPPAAWPRHVIVPGLPAVVNQAPADIDGDGIPEVALQTHFAMQAARSEGHNWIIRRAPESPHAWTAQKIDSYPTSHHIVWADLDGDGRQELLNAPLVGAASVAPTYDHDTAPMFWYDQATWIRHTVTRDIPGIVHRVRVVNWDNDPRDELLVASFEGIALYKAAGHGAGMTFTKTLLSPGHADKAPRLGASDVGVGTHEGRRLLASVEPWHGNEVVVYVHTGGGWRRRVIFDRVGAGHEVLVTDLNGDARADVVATDNSRVTPQRPDATPGVHVFYAPRNPLGDPWTYQRLESTHAMNGCAAGDVNRDARMDIACTGAGGVVRWYENLGPPRTP